MPNKRTPPVDMNDIMTACVDAAYNLTDKAGTQVSEMFRDIPSREDYPDYYLAITEPISLNLMKAKIAASSYANLAELQADMHQLVENAKIYNRKGSAIIKDAQNLEAAFNEEYDRLVQQRGIDPESPINVGKTWTEDDYLRVHRTIYNFKDTTGRVLSLLFRELPDEKEYADYYEKIANPIALDTIKNKIKSSGYTNIEEFIADFNTMFSNARQYNEQGSEVYNDSETLQNVFADMVGIKRGEIVDTHVTEPTGTQPEAEANSVTELEEVELKGDMYTVGDYVHIVNPQEPNLPHVGHIWKILQKESGEKLVRVCWYYHPSQTVHQASRMFLENEVFKTSNIEDISTTSIISRCYVLPVKDYTRGRPVGALANNIPVYVCESRYIDSAKHTEKIKDWGSVAPDMAGRKGGGKKRHRGRGGSRKPNDEEDGAGTGDGSASVGNISGVPLEPYETPMPLKKVPSPFAQDANSSTGVDKDTQQKLEPIALPFSLSTKSQTPSKTPHPLLQPSSSIPRQQQQNYPMSAPPPLGPPSLMAYLNRPLLNARSTSTTAIPFSNASQQSYINATMPISSPLVPASYGTIAGQSSTSLLKKATANASQPYPHPYTMATPRQIQAYAPAATSYTQPQQRTGHTSSAGSIPIPASAPFNHRYQSQISLAHQRNMHASQSQTKSPMEKINLQQFTELQGKNVLERMAGLVGTGNQVHNFEEAAAALPVVDNGVAEHFARSSSGQVLWFSAPPLDVVPATNVIHSVEYLKMKRERKRRVEEVEERDEGRIVKAGKPLEVMGNGDEVVRAVEGLAQWMSRDARQLTHGIPL